MSDIITRASPSKHPSLPPIQSLSTCSDRTCSYSTGQKQLALLPFINNSNIYLGLQNIIYVKEVLQPSLAQVLKTGLGSSSSTPLLGFEDLIPAHPPESEGWSTLWHLDTTRLETPGGTESRAFIETAFALLDEMAEVTDGKGPKSKSISDKNEWIIGFTYAVLVLEATAQSICISPHTHILRYTSYKPYMYSTSDDTSFRQPGPTDYSLCYCLLKKALLQAACHLATACLPRTRSTHSNALALKRF